MGATDLAYEAIKSKILRQELKPGAWLKEVQISKELGLTRTPVREAIIRMEREGIVRNFYGRGAFVAKFSKKEIEDLFEVREALEIKAAYCATRRANKDEMDELGKAMEEKERLFRKGVIVDFGHPQFDFHLGIIKLSKNERLISIWQTLQNQLLLMRTTSKMIAKRYLITSKEHEEILVSLRNGDFGQVETLLKSHLSKAKQNLLSTISKESNLQKASKISVKRSM